MHPKLSELKLIIGLGNIGDRYRHTRHNAGFMFVDHLYDEFEVISEWREDTKFEALIAEVRIGENQLLLAKPTTMMNGSGITVARMLNFYKLKLDQILVAYDDLDIDVGEYKIQLNKGPQIHNGLNSIRQRLGNTIGFWNLRLGIESREVRGNKQISGHGFALGKFTQHEKTSLNQILHSAATNLAATTLPSNDLE